MNATSIEPKRICDFEECGRPSKGLLAYCRSHRLQELKGAGLKPLQPWNRALPESERFWQKVELRSPEECWEWQAAVNPRTGYGFVKYGKSPKNAHRVAYILTHGEVERVIEIDHICRNRICVNPSHLRPATAKENRENHSGLPQANGTSGYRGVTWHKKREAWQATVNHYGKQHVCGFFSTRKEAAEAARLKRIELFTHNDQDRMPA